MKQEFVTLPREVVERALAALDAEDPYRAAVALRAALKQPQNHVPDAGNMVTAGWKLVPVVPTDDMEAAAETDYEQFNGGYFPDWLSAYRAMLSAAPHPPTVKECLTVEQPQANQPAMTPIAQRKLEDLMASGYTISGYSVYHERKHQHGFVTGAGLVGWWKPYGVEYPQPQVEPSTVAFCHVGDVVVCDNDSLLRRLGVKRSDKLYLHPQDLNCKSKQALLATLWGYTKEQPKRPPLTDNQIDKIAESMPGGLEGFLKGWGWRQFARAVLENDHNIK